MAKRYTEKEKVFIKNNMDKMTYKQIAEHLNRDENALGRKISYWGWSKKCSENIYKPKDDYMLLVVKNDKINIESKIDLEDVEVLKKYTWNIHLDKYLYARIKGKYKSLVRYIMNITNPDICIDHINLDTLDNRKSNLRICAKAQNNQNRPTNWINNTSGYRGVVKAKNNKWAAQIKRFGTCVRLKESNNIKDLAKISSYARAYCMPFSKDALEINQEDIPQWIKDKIDKKLGGNYE